jgi:hypothetical protein
MVELSGFAHTSPLSRKSTYWEFFMTKKPLALMLMTFAVAFTAPVFADNDPTVQQIYDAAKAGNLTQAQTMVDQVLKDHPQSAKAHYIAAEIYYRQHNLNAARGELAKAEAIDPNDSFAKPAAVEELKSALASSGSSRSNAFAPTVIRERETRSSFPVVTILVLVGAIGLLWMVFRRRPVQTYGAGYAGSGPLGGAPGPYGGPTGYGGPGAMPMGGGGIGSSIAGGLASGLAVGAGVVAGEELAHHFLDGDRRDGVIPTAAAAPVETPQDEDMGGSDFGVNQPDSWGDSSGGGDFGSSGGDDWS